MLRLVIALSIATMVIALPVSATILHVPSQYPSIQSGINASVNGDTVLVAPGTFVENILYGGKNIKLKGRGGADSTFLQPSSTVLPIIRIINGEDSTAQLMGFTIQNSGTNMAVSIENSSPTVNNNIFYHNQDGLQNDPTPLRVFSGSPHIHHNLFNNNGGIANVYISSPARFINNTIVNSQRAGIIVYNSNAIVTNNIVVGCPYYGIFNSNASLNDYNDFYLNNPNYDHSTPGAHDINLDPVFVSTPNNYNLQTSSPCIDAGNPDFQYNDPDGSTNDMGAFPYGGWLQLFPLVTNINLGNPIVPQRAYSLIPRIFWTYYDTSTFYPSGYQLQIGTDRSWDIAELWDSGPILIGDTSAVYAGSPLSYHNVYYIRIRAYNGFAWGAWSSALFEVYDIIDIPSEQPTIQSGIQAAFNFDSLIVAPGTYYEHLNLLGKKIILKSSGGPTTTFISKIFDGVPIITLESGEDSLSVINGFTIQNALSASGVKTVGSSSAKVENCVIRSNNQYGIYCASNMIIRNNVIAHNDNGIYCGTNSIVQENIIDSNTTYGMMVISGAQNVRILNNRISFSLGPIYFDGGSGHIIDRNIIYGANCPGGGVDVRNGTSNVIFTNNTLARNHSTNGTGAGMVLRSPSNWQIKNNIIASNTGGYGIYVTSPVGLSLTYNNVYGNQLGNYFGCIPSTGSISLDPQFISASAYDFRLTGSSPCVDAGDPSSPFDPDGTATDMGALYFDQQYRILNFSLLTPQNNIILTDAVPTLTWEPTADIDSGYPVYYNTWWCTDSLFVIFDSSGTSPVNSYTMSQGLTRSLWYFWKVFASNYHATPIFSNEIWRYYVDGYPGLPEITGPSNGAIADTTTYLSWTIGIDPDPMDTVSYTLQVDNDPQFGSPEISVGGITDQGIVSDEAVAIRISDLLGHQNLQNGQAYYWRIRADDEFGLNSGFTDGSNYFTFGANVNDPPNAPISGFFPSGNQEINNPSPVITWDHAIDPDPDDNPGTLTYGLQLDSDSTFGTPDYEYITQPSITQVTVGTALPDGGRWFYRVKTIDDGGLMSPWSQVQSFRIRLYNLSPEPPIAGFDPSNDEEITMALPLIVWDHGADPDPDDGTLTLHYIVQIAQGPDFDTALTEEFTTADGQNFLTVLDSLAEDTHMHYRIKTVDDGNLASAWSQAQSFWTNYTNRPPITPSGEFYPSEGQLVADPHPSILWDASTDPDAPDFPQTLSYVIDLDSDGEFDTSIAYTYNSNPGQTSIVVTDSLSDSHWYCRIKAIDDGSLESGYSAVQDFIVNFLNSPPQPPIVGFSPSNGDEVISLTPILAWANASDPDPDDHPGTLSYALELDIDTLFAGFVYRDTTGQGENLTTIFDPLFDNTHYFYRLKTLDDGGLSSGWSVIQNFWTNHYNFPPEPFPLFAPNNGQKQVVYYTHFSWGNTVDYDPNSSFTFTLQYSPDSLFRFDIGTISGLADTAASVVTDSLVLSGLVYWRILAIDDDSLSRTGGLPEGPRSLLIIPPGDANASGATNGIDVTYLVSYLKGNSPPPDPIEAGDANGNCATNGIDVVYLVAHLKGIGAPPVRPDCGQILKNGPMKGIIDENSDRSNIDKKW